MNLLWCARPLAGPWDGSARSRRSPAWPSLGDETKVVRRAAAEALRAMGNRFNGSHGRARPRPSSTGW